MQDDHSDPSDATQDEDAPVVRDRRRIDPDSGKQRSSDPVELPGGGVLSGNKPEPPPEVEVAFGDLVRPFLMMGLTGVGVLPHPDTGKPATDLATTKHAIATLELLQAKTEGQRTGDETSMLEQALFELKMQFVEAQRRVSEE